MDNREGTFIWVGALAIACLGYFYTQKREQRLQHISNKNIIKDKCRQIIDNGKKIDFQRIKESGRKEYIFFPDISQYTIEQDTYTRFVRHQKNMDYFGRQLGTIREGETGGRFSFQDPISKQQIIAEINDCKIQQFVLSEKKKNNIVFKENINKIAYSCNLTYKIKEGESLALFGLIGYSITQRKFIFQPHFIMGGRESSQGILQRLTHFWQQKIEKVAFQKMLLGFSILAISYIFIYHPIKSIWSRYRTKFEDISKEKLKHFVEKAQFSAKISSNLTCELCKNNSVNIIYECGHLCVCQMCNVGNKDQKCPICNKFSSKSIKIFL